MIVPFPLSKSRMTQIKMKTSSEKSPALGKGGGITQALYGHIVDIRV